jgi:hypothetical protein
MASTSLKIFEHIADPQAEKRGIAYEDLLIIDPERFQDGADGPCHTPGSNASASGRMCCGHWS